MHPWQLNVKMFFHDPCGTLHEESLIPASPSDGCSGGSYSQQYKELLFHFLEMRWRWEQELLLQTRHSLLFPSKTG